MRKTPTLTRTHGGRRVALLVALAVVLGGGACPPTTEPEVDPGPQGNRAPTAIAGPDFSASVGLATWLSGMATDPDGDPATYDWTLDAPDGSTAALDDATSPEPSFTPDVAGDYLATLVVNDGTVASAPDAVTITAEDNTSTETIGETGGSVTSLDGDFSFTIPPGALDADAQVGLTPLATSQLGALGSLQARLDPGTALAYEVRIGDPEVRVPLALPGTIAWETETDSQGDTTRVAVPEIMWSDSAGAEPVDDQQTNVDWDLGKVLHTGMLGSGGLVTIVPNQLDLLVFGLPEVAVVDQVFPATVIATWTGDGPVPEEAEVGSAEEGVLSRVSPAVTPVRVTHSNGAFVTTLEYRCDVAGTGTVVLLATTLRQQGDPTGEGRFPVMVERDVTCTPGGSGGGFPTGLQSLPMRDVQAVYSLQGGVFGSVERSPADAFLIGGLEGIQLRGTATNQVLVDGTVQSAPQLASAPRVVQPNPGADNPLTRAAAVSRPNPGPGTPAAIFGSGQNLVAGIGAMGLLRYDYDTGTESFATTPDALPGAYWDMQPAGGMITDELVAATNFGVDFIQWDGTTWSHALDERLPLSRYGNERLVAIGSVAAAEAFGPLLVGIAYHSGAAGRLFFDDRGDGGPVDIGELGVSPAMIRCALPVCVAVVARDHAVRTILWDGVTEPTMVGDPIPVGVDPGAVTLHRLANDVTLAAAFTGWTDDDVTLLELDDDAAVLSSTTMDLRAVGCRGPRNGAWMVNPDDPSDPYLLIACFSSSGYYLTLRSAF